MVRMSGKVAVPARLWRGAVIAVMVIAWIYGAASIPHADASSRVGKAAPAARLIHRLTENAGAIDAIKARHAENAGLFAQRDGAATGAAVGMAPLTTCPTGAAVVDASSVYYTVNNYNSTTGANVTVYFNVAAGCSGQHISLVSYRAPGRAYDANTADQQTVADSSDGYFSTGWQQLTVTVPACYYQVDLVAGDVIQHLGPADTNPNNFYSAQNRLIAHANDGDVHGHANQVAHRDPHGYGDADGDRNQDGDADGDRNQDGDRHGN